MEKSGFLSNFSWKFFERIFAQLISLVVSIILARLLEPENYGIVSIVMIFITFANVFVSEGLGTALIQKKNADALDFFSVLYFNLFLSLIIYIILFFTAPLLVNIYGNSYNLLNPVIKVLGVRIILTAINSVQQAYISKKMLFQKSFISALWGTIISAIVGISMAYAGFGVWALVAQYLISTSVSTLTLAIVIKRRPRFIFSFTRLKSLVPFGARILATGLIITGYQEIQALIIGKKYTPAMLAYYDKAKSFPNLAISNVNASLASVLFPKMTLVQEKKENVKELVRKTIRFGSFLLCPLLMGLSAVAETFISLLLTEKWLNCVPLLRLFCIMYLFYPIHTANMQAIKATGRSDITLKVEILKKIIEVVVLLVTMTISVTAMVVGMATCATIFTAINAYPNKKLINYGVKEQIKDISPFILMSLCMFLIVYLMNFIPIIAVFRLLLQVLTGFLIYVVLCLITKNSEFKYAYSVLKKLL